MLDVLVDVAVHADRAQRDAEVDERARRRACRSRSPRPRRTMRGATVRLPAGGMRSTYSSSPRPPTVGGEIAGIGQPLVDHLQREPGVGGVEEHELVAGRDVDGDAEPGRRCPRRGWRCARSTAGRRAGSAPPPAEHLVGRRRRRRARRGAGAPTGSNEPSASGVEERQAVAGPAAGACARARAGAAAGRRVRPVDSRSPSSTARTLVELQHEPQRRAGAGRRGPGRARPRSRSVDVAAPACASAP